MRFRNSHKRWDPRTGQKIYRSVQSEAKRSDFFGEGLEEYYSAHPTMVQPQTAQEEKVRVMAGMVPDDGDVQPLGAAPIAGDLWVKYFALMFSSLRRWFRSFWTAARFQKTGDWMSANRLR